MSAIMTPTTVTKQKAKGITVRRPFFKPKKISRYYFARSPFASHLLTAMSATFPIGEQFFVHSVRNVRDRVVDDPQLQAQISAFIGQEAMHSQAHGQFNDSWRRDDYQLDGIMTMLAREDKRIKEIPARYQLAITCAFEHFTAMLGEYMLSHPELINTFDEEAKNLWIWHAIEESEHKSVAYDVYQHVFDDLKVRRRMMRVVTTAFFSIMGYGTWQLLWQDRRNSLPQIRDNLRGVGFLAKMVVTLLPEYLEYYKADFHPAQRDRTALLNQWRSYLDQRMAAAA